MKDSQLWTPGPWEASKGSFLCQININTESETLATVYGDTGENEANAHVIAAAPELYAAVENLIAAITPLHNAHFQIERECISDSDVEDAQAAVRDAEIVLAKARGEHHEK